MPGGDYSAIRGELLDGLVRGIDHVGVCVANLDEAGRAWSALLGRPAVDREDVASLQTSAVFLRMAEPGAVELVCPMPNNPGLTRFLGSRGDALHHIAFAVTDIRTALARLLEAGVPVIDREARRGAGGHLVAFIHPKAMGGTLVELVERTSQRTEGQP